MRKIAEEFPTYSDFNFVSLFTWNNDGSISITYLNGNLIVKFSDYTNGEVFLSFLGVNRILNTINLLLNYCTENNIEPKLRLIGQSVVDALSGEDRDKYRIEEDRDNHDYILSAANMADLTKIDPRKRTKYNHFLRKHGNHAVCRELNLNSESTHIEIKQLLVDWQRTRGRSDIETEREFAAINRCLMNSKELNIHGYGTYVRDKLTAFTLFELVHNKTAMLHFGKSNINIKGSNEHLQHNLAKYLQILDVELMNNEQDLGIEGLRNSKKASLPVYFLKKYTISLAPKK